MAKFVLNAKFIKKLNILILISVVVMVIISGVKNVKENIIKLIGKKD